MNSNDDVSRRQMLGKLGAGFVTIAGYDPEARRWLTRAEAAACPTFADAPNLDGVLLLDAATREADGHDKGNIVFRTPCAVLRPGSVDDIKRMVHYCRRYDLKVSARGAAHTMFGRSLSPGLVIESGALNQIHSIGPNGADVDAGVRWKDLLIASYAQGLTPPVLTVHESHDRGHTIGRRCLGQVRRGRTGRSCP